MNTASPDDIDISALWQSLRRSVPKLLALSIAAGIAAYVILSFVTPEYSSEAQIQLVAPKRDAQTSDAASAEAVAARMDKEAINTHVRALMSPDLAVEVINAEGLAKKPEFNSALQPPTLIGRAMHAFDFGHSTETEQERVLRAYFDRLDVYSPKESRFIGIRFTSADPKLSAAVANKLAEVYRVSLATRTVAETDEVQQALQPKIDKLMKEVAEAEAAVEKFRGDANIFKGGPADTGLNQQQLGDLNAELDARRRRHAGKPKRGPLPRATWSVPATPSRFPRYRNRRSFRIWCSSACGWSGSSPSCRRRCYPRIRACGRSRQILRGCSARSSPRSVKSSRASRKALKPRPCVKLRRKSRSTT